MNQTKFLLVAVGTIAFLRAAHGNAAVDQRVIPELAVTTLNVGASNNIDWAQTFTAGITGQLTGFDLWIEKYPSVTQPLLWDVRTISAGVPTEPDEGVNILASGSVAAALIPSNEVFSGPPPKLPVHFDMSGVYLPVSVGEVFAIVLRSDDPGLNDYGIPYFWRGAADGPIKPAYAGGKAILEECGALECLWSLSRRCVQDIRHANP